MATLTRVLSAVVLFAITAFSLFGFLASFEPGVATSIWATGYGVAGFSSLAGAIVLSWSLFSASKDKAS